MNEEMINRAVNQDKEFCWHPFTRQTEWCVKEHRPVMIESGDGVWLEDMEGNRYIDGNASIWTNIHGHNHTKINAAINHQLGKVAHSSFLGYGHALASELAERLCSFFSNTSLKRVFYSDNGSTAVECALKMGLQYRMQSGQPERQIFIAFYNAYHGDTLGAASLGGVDAFFARFRKLGIKVCFVKDLEELKKLPDEKLKTVSGVIIEPLIQGVNEMRTWPQGMLTELRLWTEQQGIHLILDEVMTGFGRSGEMFACQREGVTSDFLCLAKGLTGGYLPMAATLVREEIYAAFLGDPQNAFYYGHSYTANPLGCAAALASLDLFEEEQTLAGVAEKSIFLEHKLNHLSSKIPHVFETRRCGMMAGIEIRQTDGERFPVTAKVGEKICFRARSYQLLTRPILDTLVFLPPLSITRDEIDIAFAALESAIMDELG